MAEKPIRLDTVDDYDRLFGLETLHPLVNVIDLATATKHPTHFTVNYGIYALFLKETKCGDIRYGRQTYDYREGTITSFSPGQVSETEMQESMRPTARGIVFHPDLIKGTSLGREIKNYSFFSYNSTEALHLSADEKGIMLDCLANIKTELLRPADKMSKRLIARNIQLLLDYCLRFYNRQFATREKSNRDILTRFEALLDDYFQSGKSRLNGLPTVRYFADKVFLSPNYLGDLIKKETGRNPQEYIQGKTIDTAKTMLADTGKAVNQIADELGFQYSQHFNMVFKKVAGCTPSQYRKWLAAT